MENFNLLVNAGVENGGILQPVAKRFVIQRHARAGRNLRRRGRIPVVDPFVLLHELSAAPTRRA